jgi:hypothetical protein
MSKPSSVNLLEHDIIHAAADDAQANDRPSNFFVCCARPIRQPAGQVATEKIPPPGWTAGRRRSNQSKRVS